MLIIFFVLFFLNCMTMAAIKKRNYVKSEENESRIQYFLTENYEGHFGLEDLVNSKIQARATSNDITFYLYTQSNKEDGIALFQVETDLPTTIFDPTKEILVTIHGWRNYFDSQFNTNLKSAILDVIDINLVVIDWSQLAQMNYVTAKNAVPQIGKFIGQFIESLSSAYDIPLWRISFVGHSLGAHIAGVAGTFLKGKIGQIVGLDPAGPLVSVSDKSYCLDPSDAQFVHVIHTNGGLLGLSTSIGHADYFPNGGKRQPGCGFDITGSCAHGRAYKYYTESIRQNLFTSQECTSYQEFSKRKCNGRFSLMGGYDVHQGITGDFYLNTNEKSPYARGKP